MTVGQDTYWKLKLRNGNGYFCIECKGELRAVLFRTKNNAWEFSVDNGIDALPESVLIPLCASSPADRSNLIMPLRNGSKWIDIEDIYDIDTEMKAIEWQKRTDRIKESRNYLFEHDEERKWLKAFAMQCVGGGFNIEVNHNQNVRYPIIQRAETVTEHIKALVQPKLTIWAWNLLTEGEQFTQVITSDSSIVNVVSMPVCSMKRVTNDIGEFIDPARAFCQMDLNLGYVSEPIAYWPVTSMHHSCLFRMENGYGQSYLDMKGRVGFPNFDNQCSIDYWEGHNPVVRVLTRVVRYITYTGLMLSGLLPEEIRYDVRFVPYCS